MEQGVDVGDVGSSVEHHRKQENHADDVAICKPPSDVIMQASQFAPERTVKGDEVEMGLEFPLPVRLVCFFEGIHGVRRVVYATRVEGKPEGLWPMGLECAGGDLSCGGQRATRRKDIKAPRRKQP